MRDPKGTPSRREFCAAAGAGLLVLGLPACDPGDPRLGVGGIDQTGGGGGTGGNGGSGGGTGGNGGSGGGTGGNGNGNGGTADMAQPAPGGDMAGQPPPDMAGQPSPDMAQGQTCNTSMVNAGAASSYTVGGTPKYFSKAKAFVLRDAGGLFAVSAVCTHDGCTNQYQNGQFVCPCHFATFALDGTKPTSPAPSGTSGYLKHHALCIDASGTVWVNPTKGSADMNTRY